LLTIYATEVRLDVTLSKCNPLPQKCIWARYDLWPLTLKTFLAVATHKFHWNTPLSGEISRRAE